MISTLPLWLSILMLMAVVATILLFYYSNNQPRPITLGIVIWAVLQSLLAYQGFYQNVDAIPPRYGLIIIPVLLMVAYGLLAKQRLWFTEHRDLRISTFLHTVRLPVEIVLHQLFIYGMVPELMTYEGRNLDIIIGISAPIVGLLYFRNLLSEKLLLVWNIIGLISVLFIFMNAILSAELQFQLFAFDQPNRALIYFPFVLLPAVIVPIVIWTHLSDIIILMKKTR